MPLKALAAVNFFMNISICTGFMRHQQGFDALWVYLAGNNENYYTAKTMQIRKNEAYPTVCFYIFLLLQSKQQQTYLYFKYIFLYL